MINLQQRVSTGLILLIGISGLVWLGEYTFLLLILLINGLGLFEFYRLFSSSAIAPLKTTGLLVSIAWLISEFSILVGYTNPALSLIAIPLVFSLFLIQLFSISTHPIQNIAFTVLGLICVTLPLSFFMAIGISPGKPNPYQSALLLNYFSLVWASDTGAFVTGKAVGKHPLFRRISPNKTWEGSLGGAACAGLTALLVHRFVPTLSLAHWLVIALIVVVSGTFGDLIKSMMKRSLGVKDAGTILPGHGGILDRFDSLLGSAPFVFAYQTLCSTL